MTYALKINTKGEIVPMELVQLRDEFNAEAKNHIKTFSDFFFSYDQNNYQKQIENALWLGDSSIKEAYERLKNIDRWHDKVVQNSLIQKIIWRQEEKEIEIQKDPKEEQTIFFRVNTILELNRLEYKNFYDLELKGKLKKVSRFFPKNPHGLLITHFSYERKEIKQ